MVAAMKHYWYVMKHHNDKPQEPEDEDDLLAQEDGDAPVQELVTATKRMLTPMRSKSSAQLLFGDETVDDVTHGHGHAPAPAAEEKDIAVTFVDSASSMQNTRGTAAKAEPDSKPNLMCCGV